MGSWLLYRLTDLIAPLPVEEHHEQLGLDLSQHGESITRMNRLDHTETQDYPDYADYRISS